MAATYYQVCPHCGAKNRKPSKPVTWHLHCICNQSSYVKPIKTTGPHQQTRIKQQLARQHAFQQALAEDL